jgi:hypothetical protein
MDFLLMLQTAAIFGIRNRYLAIIVVVIIIIIVLGFVLRNRAT